MKHDLSAAAFFLATLFIISPAYATDKVTSPYVEKGQLKLEWRGGLTYDDDSEKMDDAWKQKASIEYGLTKRVAVEIKGDWDHPGDTEETDFTALALESKVQLTEKNQYWLDAGIKGTYKFNTADGDHPDSVEGKLLLVKDTKSFKHMANLVLEHEVGDDAADDWLGSIYWGSRYHLRPELEPGFEIYSAFGPLDHTGEFDEQKHKAGPVFYGKLGHFKYEAGYLVGVSDAAADGTFKALLAYEIPLHTGK